MGAKLLDPRKNKVLLDLEKIGARASSQVSTPVHQVGRAASTMSSKGIVAKKSQHRLLAAFKNGGQLSENELRLVFKDVCKECDNKRPRPSYHDFNRHWNSSNWWWWVTDKKTKEQVHGTKGFIPIEKMFVSMMMWLYDDTRFPPADAADSRQVTITTAAPRPGRCRSKQ